METSIRAKAWQSDHPPKKILVMRFQALGDTIITLPYLQSLRRQYPQIQIHFLTRKEVSAIPTNVLLFDKVISIGGGRNLKLQLAHLLLWFPWLFLQQYDAVIDLQNHKLSRLIRKLVFKKAWTEFDKQSPIAAGDRTKRTIEALWKWRVNIDHQFSFINQPARARQLLINAGWEEHQELVVLNPAGYCLSRSWPLEYYVTFAKAWLQSVNPMTQFVLLLLPAHQDKANYIKAALGTHCIDLTGQANQVDAFQVIHQSVMMITEDSGLMHMAWVQGVPTLALFSSSRKDWSAPLGDRSYCFDSSDMDCGPCMLEVCQYGDNRCLVRHTPQNVLQKALYLYGGR